MSRIVKTINPEVVARTARRCRERGIIIPSYAQMRDPGLIPAAVKARLKGVGLWDVNPVNLFRITWKNDPASGQFGAPNAFEIPRAITGVKARIIGLVGKFFPTGAHKVGAAFSCLVPRLVSGEFDPEKHKAVWPSTGNYCRGGAFDSVILGCTPVAVLPENMSRERFQWLEKIGSEVIATPGCESNVKEIYDKCWELRKTRGSAVSIFNQFEEFGNAIWHYEMTGANVEQIFNLIKKPGSRLAGYVSATGSAGTIAAGDYLRTRFPHVKVIATEALQCPTLLMNGFGGHRIEGIGDKHVPWIHNVRNTDMVAAIDDEQCMCLLRLFNEEEGVKFLDGAGIKAELREKLPLVGISSICNLVAAIKAAKYWELTENDVIFTPMTDSMDLYKSRKQELRDEHGAYSRELAARHFSRYLEGIEPDHLRELSYPDRKALHNLKYFTWVEQQGKTVEELHQLWNPDFWTETFAQVPEWDKLIVEFNERTGLLKSMA